MPLELWLAFAVAVAALVVVPGPTVLVDRAGDGTRVGAGGLTASLTRA